MRHVNHEKIKKNFCTEMDRKPRFIFPEKIENVACYDITNIKETEIPDVTRYATLVGYGNGIDVIKKLKFEF